MIYDFAEGEAFKHDFALSDQIRRTAISILSNISEGYESRTQVVFIEYLGRVKASAGEVRALLYFAVDRKYVTDDPLSKASQVVVICSKQISRLITYLESRPNARRTRMEGASYDVQP
jgi:four helix bundle protein